MSTKSGKSATGARFRFTARQEQVLDLLVRGYSNAQVAEALGVSLDGAKWHVREILSILGVETREDAAEFWREHNGLPRRLRRALRSVIPAGLALRFGLAAALLLAMAAVLVAVTVLRGGGDARPATPDPTEMPPSTPVAATPPTSPPAATPTTSVAGSPAAEPMAVGPAVRLPSEIALYYSWAGIEGPYQNLWRAYTNAAGELVTENLYANLPPGQPFASVQDFATGRFAVALCRVSYCGGYGPAQADSQAVLALSEDGGVSWREAGPIPVWWFPVGFLPQGLLGAQYQDELQRDVHYAVYPGGPTLNPPRPGLYAQVLDGRLAFRDSESGQIYDEHGAILYQPPAIPGAVQVFPVWAIPSLRWSGWITVQPTGEGRQYFGEFDGGRLLRAFTEPAGTLYPWAPLDDTLVVGRYDSPDLLHLDPVLVDFDRGLILPLDGLGNPRGYFVALGVAGGPFRVAWAGSGSCLNVREQPRLDSAALGCVADGVLLASREGQPVTAGGIEWRPIAMPDGRPGWAAAEYLQ